MFFVTTLGQGPNTHKIEYVTESDKAALPEYEIGNGKAVKESNMSQSQIVTKSKNACYSTHIVCQLSLMQSIGNGSKAWM